MMVMLLTSERELEDITSTPSMPEIESSSTLVTWLSITSAEAPRYTGLDVHDRLVDLRVLAHRHARVRDRADQQHGEREHGREDRPLDAYLGQRHPLVFGGRAVLRRLGRASGRGSLDTAHGRARRGS
jgi:hypothetical protein